MFSFPDNNICLQYFGSEEISINLQFLDFTCFQKPKRRTAASYAGRSPVPDKSERSSRSMSFSPERVRVRGRSPSFNALAANFENPNARNLSTPPLVRKPSPKPVPLDPTKLAPKSPAIANLSASFERPKEVMIPKSIIPKSLKGICGKYFLFEKKIESL